MVFSKGSTSIVLQDNEIDHLLQTALDPLILDGKRVLVIIPDSTRTAPIPRLFRNLYDHLGQRVEQLDYLIALGTHPIMSDEAISRLIGVTSEELPPRFPNVAIFNHRWDVPEALVAVGEISAKEMDDLTGGLLALQTPVSLNRMILEYDHILICGPVFPHEVVGFSGGAKYLFPGIAGEEIINNTHWLGALCTSMKTIGIKDTPIRRVIHKALSFIDRPITCICLVLKGHDLYGMSIGPPIDAFDWAADLSAQLNIILKPHPFKSVLSMPALMYDDMWTAAKAMYKTEPIVADGGEVIIYAPHLQEISYTHGALIRQVGYHVLEFFLKQWETYSKIPLAILAHSTHLFGAGTYENGIERARIQVTLATAIPEHVCREINLGYRDPSTINPGEWTEREDDGILLVREAGEYLYRLE